MSYHKQKLNAYELAYFERFFGTNIKRLLALRKSFSKKIVSRWNYEDDHLIRGCQTIQRYKTKGGVEHTVNLSKKSIDLYLEMIGYVKPRPYHPFGYVKPKRHYFLDLEENKVKID
jgi:hypothetical protein